MSLARLKFLPKNGEFPLSNSRNCGSVVCLHFDVVDQVERAFLLWNGRGGDLEGGCAVRAIGCATRIAHYG